MATGHIILPVVAAVLPDGSTNNAAAQFQRVKSSAAAPSLHFVELLFDAGTDEHAYWTFQMPSDYASSPVLRIAWKANATTNAVVWVGKLAAITASDADTPNEKALAADNSATGNVNTTEARRLVQTTITMSNADSVAANDWVVLGLFRDANNGSDTCTVDAELVGVTLEYTTT